MENLIKKTVLIALFVVNMLNASEKTDSKKPTRFGDKRCSAPAAVATTIARHPVFRQRRQAQVHPEVRHNNFTTKETQPTLKRTKTHITPKDVRLWKRVSGKANVIPVRVAIEAARGRRGNTIIDEIDVQVDINAYGSGQELIDAIWTAAAHKLQRSSCLHRLNYAYMKHTMYSVTKDGGEKEAFISCYIEHMQPFNKFTTRTKLAKDDSKPYTHKLGDFQIESPTKIDFNITAPCTKLYYHPVHYSDTKYRIKQYSICDFCSWLCFHTCSVPITLREIKTETD